jgi:hypothetical protein
VTATPAPSTLPPAAMQTPPARPTTTATLSPEPTTPPPTKDAVTGSIPFAAQSANLNDVAKSEIDRIAKNIVDKKLRQIDCARSPAAPIPTTARSRWRGLWSCAAI